MGRLCKKSLSMSMYFKFKDIPTFAKERELTKGRMEKAVDNHVTVPEANPSPIHKCKHHG